MNKNFTKADLKVGYVVKQRNGDLRMVVSNDEGTIYFLDNAGNFNGGDFLNPDLTNSKYKPYDIMEVYGFSTRVRYALTSSTDTRKLLWKREEAKKMTVAEIEKALGYEVEVVAEEVK